MKQSEEAVSTGFVDVFNEDTPDEIKWYALIAKDFLIKHSGEIMAWLLEKAEREYWTPLQLGEGMVSVMQGAISQIKRMGEVNPRLIDEVMRKEGIDIQDDSDPGLDWGG